ncbi:agmatinase, mitochondrial isoform X2 [Lingula anatina]|uniref:Agmatinase, mitochondrial isoform X2 n=1 Tax=Lingula anatina TaxID=7574 RepID=A0A1S3ITD4_LINAN|nr:agmatinase, mitochondrial isoform X2 [Lingula anatina]|eukprot:XP_013401191.1 agmatinase, mitochondrial isoform X2 [Lingula anatina]
MSRLQLLKKFAQVVTLQVQQSRTFQGSAQCFRKFNAPLSGNDLARPAGIASMMRLPVQETSEDLDVCFVGVPLDAGTSNRSGTRFGPRQIRSESCIIRHVNNATGAQPFDSIQVADVGDVWMNIYNLPEACKNIKDGFTKLMSTGCKTLAVGGDHTITWPILQAVKEKHGPVGLIHVDAHADTQEAMLGAPIAHGTPFKRAADDGCLDCQRVVQIGLRGTCGTLQDYKWGESKGFRIVQAHECWHKSLAPLMEEVREMMRDGPVYISFDIDGIDPAFAPGTGTPEIAGLTPIQALEIIRGCRGLNIVGGDLVEVSPPYDTTGNTALLAANLLFEMLCVFPGVKYADV